MVVWLAYRQQPGTPFIAAAALDERTNGVAVVGCVQRGVTPHAACNHRYTHRPLRHTQLFSASTRVLDRSTMMQR
jgi:hypothetical protein